MRNLGRWGYLYSATAISYMLCAPFAAYEYGWKGTHRHCPKPMHYFNFSGHFGNLAVALCFYLVDVLTSDALSENLASLEKNGFSRSRVATIAFLNYSLGTIVPALVVCGYLHQQVVIPYRFDFTLVWHVGFCLAVSEVLFFYSHRYMHQHMPQVHFLHHCCKRPSFTTNLLFDPVDLAIEFTGPVLGLIFFTLVVFDDPLAMIVGMGIITAWYASDHDEYLQLHHYHHHKFINSNYAIYIKVPGYDPKDQIRKMFTK